MRYFSTIGLIFILANLSFSQTSILEKKTSINTSNSSIEDVLVKIEKLCGCNFSYNSDLFLNEEKININIQNQSINFLLKKVLGIKFYFIVIDNKIVIKRKKKILLSSSSSQKVEKLDSTPFIEARKEEKILPLRKKRLSNVLISNDSLHDNIDLLNLPFSSNTLPRRRVAKIGCTVFPAYKLSENNKSNFSFGFGTFFDYRLIDRLNASIGLLFFNTRLIKNDFDFNQLNNTQLINPSEDTARTYYSKLFILDMPISIRYDFLKRRGTFFLTFGLSSTYLNIKYNYLYNEEKVKYGTYYKFGMFNFMSFSGGYEKEFGLFNNFSFQIEPFIKFSLIKYSPENINLTYVGLFMRTNYFLRKK